MLQSRIVDEARSLLARLPQDADDTMYILLAWAASQYEDACATDCLTDRLVNELLAAMQIAQDSLKASQPLQLAAPRSGTSGTWDDDVEGAA